MADTANVGWLRRGTRGVGVPELIAGTTLLILLTALLGVLTKAAGAGLACEARWPVCDGGFLNLLPATVPSFFEWIHRVVAGVTGFAVLGATVAAWRTDVPRGARWAATAGLVLLPIQVVIGRETVLQYTAPILEAHFWLAFAIFASFVAASALTWQGALTPGRLRTAALVGAGLVPLQLVLHPPVVTSYTPTVQTIQYAVTFLVFAAALTVALAGRGYLSERQGLALLALPILHPLLVSVSRQMLAPSTELVAAYGLLSVAVFVGLLAAGVAFHRTITR